MNKRIIPAAAFCLAIAGMVSANESCPMSVDNNDVEAKPVSWRCFADAYGFTNGHYRFGSIDPFPPVGIVDPACGPDLTVGRGAYVGSVKVDPLDTTADANDFVTVFVFSGDDITASANKYALRLRSVQNFVGNAFTLTAKILENRGDEVDSPGARGLFNRSPVAAGTNATANGGLGPFGAPAAGVLNTVTVDARSDRGDLLNGSCTIAGFGLTTPMTTHDSGSGATYDTLDKDIDLVLGSGSSDPGLTSVRAAVRKAQSSGVSYPTCRYSCLSTPRVFNSSCDVEVRNPIYVAVTAVAGGDAAAAERLQDSLTVDNLIHLMGDTDFCGEAAVGDICGVTFVSKR